MKGEENYAIFIDHSGSVNGKNNYWEVVGNIVKNKNLIDRYFFWYDHVREVDYDRVKDSQSHLRGWGGTDTTAVARKIVQEKLTHIILITDAEVDKAVVKKTDEVLELAALHNFTIVSSICYIICTSNHNLNMSSVCPFTRYGSSSVYLKHRHSEMKLVACHEITDNEYIKNLDSINLKNFEFEIKRVEKIIIKLNMGKSGLPAIRDQLLALRKRLVYQISIMKTEENYSKAIRACLEQQDTITALGYA
jgi:hypothetical protein